MPVEAPTAIVSPTTNVLSDEGIGSAWSERLPIVRRTLADDADTERNQKTTRFKAGVETAPETPRPKMRFPRLMPIIEAHREDFVLLEKWDGVVLSEDEKTFTARLYRADEPGRSTQAVFDKSELSSEERGQIQEGASFVWTIGYRHIGATRHRDSVLYFRRFVPWETKELKAAELRGANLKNTIGWE